MRAAYLWSIHDFPAYGDFSGWSTHGRLACPICLCDSKAFRLRHGHKACWFDCHRRFLPSDHVFRFEANAFRKDTVIHDEPPRHLTGVQSNANQSKSVRDDGGNFERSSPNGVHSSTNNATRVIADGGSSERNSPDGVQSNRNQSRRIAADGGNFRRNSPASVQFNRNKSRSLATDDGNYERSDANAGNPQQNGDGPSDGNSERIIANASDSQQNGSGDGAQGTEGVNSQLNVGSKQGCENPSKRGRGKLTRTELKMVPRSGRVQLEPSGDCQFKYVGYTPRGYKYPSQVGAILKREYPGIITAW